VDIEVLEVSEDLDVFSFFKLENEIIIKLANLIYLDIFFEGVLCSSVSVVFLSLFVFLLFQ
jgi:energy-converting hydrogenase Eha subunit C